MSRGFVKEGDQEEIPMVPPRAFLPPGMANYVTAVGFEQLMQERNELLSERDNYSTGDQENYNRVMRNFVNAKLDLLENRIRTAKIIKHNPKDEVVFGSTITIKMNNTEMVVQITGVDEASANKGKIPFTSPLAKALLGHRAGEFLDVLLPTGLQTVKIIKIDEI